MIFKNNNCLLIEIKKIHRRQKNIFIWNINGLEYELPAI
jgi:hypothetical protein